MPTDPPVHKRVTSSASTLFPLSGDNRENRTLCPPPLLRRQSTISTLYISILTPWLRQTWTLLLLQTSIFPICRSKLALVRAVKQHRRQFKFMDCRGRWKYNDPVDVLSSVLYWGTLLADRIFFVSLFNLSKKEQVLCRIMGIRWKTKSNGYIARLFLERQKQRRWAEWEC